MVVAEAGAEDAEAEDSTTIVEVGRVIADGADVAAACVFPDFLRLYSLTSSATAATPSTFNIPIAASPLSPTAPA